MSNERTAIIIIAGLGLAFLIALGDRLQRPLNPVGDLSTGGQIATMVAALAALVLIGGSVFAWRRNNQGEWLKTAAIWTAIIVGVAMLLGVLTGSFSGPNLPIDP